MNIYEIGEEKCIEGVWGREVNGRFYTYVKDNDTKHLYRKLSVNTTESSYFAWCSCNASDGCEYVISDVNYAYHAYTPKHIKDFENLKRGDVVWVRSIEYENKEQWAIARYIDHDGYDYLVSNLFNKKGKSLSHYYCKEVFLKPPFDF
jgi:hypothetical protein